MVLRSFVNTGVINQCYLLVLVGRKPAGTRGCSITPFTGSRVRIFVCGVVKAVVGNTAADASGEIESSCNGLAI